MANFYTEIPELKYHLNNPMMKRICELKERNYRDKDEFDYALLDFEDALDSYDKVLEITGEITVSYTHLNGNIWPEYHSIIQRYWHIHTMKFPKPFLT